MDNSEVIIMATSGTVYENMCERIAELEAQERKFLEREQTWLKEIKYQSEKVLQKSTEFERCKSLNSTLVLHLSKFVQQEEVTMLMNEVSGIDLFPSPERAKDYIESSTFLRKNFDRKDYGNIDEAQRWYDSQGI